MRDADLAVQKRGIGVADQRKIHSQTGTHTIGIKQSDAAACKRDIEIQCGTRRRDRQPEAHRRLLPGVGRLRAAGRLDPHKRPACADAGSVAAGESSIHNLNLALHVGICAVAI